MRSSACDHTAFGVFTRSAKNAIIAFPATVKCMVSLSVVLLRETRCLVVACESKTARCGLADGKSKWKGMSLY